MIINKTDIYTTGDVTVYLVYYYYSILKLVGAEIIPTNSLEVITATFLLLMGTVIVGIIIGEFSALLAAYTQKERLKTEEVRISSICLYGFNF